MTPTTTVVIATRNRATALLRAVSQLESLPERPAIIVVDNASSDGTPERVREAFTNVLVVELQTNMGSAARTIGAERAHSAVVAFSDDDSWWVAGSLARAADLFDRYPRLGLVAARVLVGEERRLDETCAQMAASPLATSDALPGPPILGFLACGSVVRRRAFLDVGGFHPRLGIGGEEALLAVDLSAAGWGLAYVDDLVVHHHPFPVRNAGLRKAIETRNELWFSWLRLPAHRALVETSRLASRAVGDASRRAGIAEAMRGLPWVMRERNPISAELAADVMRLRREPHASSLDDRARTK